MFTSRTLISGSEDAGPLLGPTSTMLSDSPPLRPGSNDPDPDPLLREDFSCTRPTAHGAPEAANAKNAKGKNTSTSTGSLGAATTGGSSSYSGPSRTLSSSTSSTGGGLSNDNKHQRILNYPLTPEVGPRELVLLEAPPVVEKFDVATRPDGEAGVLGHDREHHHAGMISSNHRGGAQYNGNGADNGHEDAARPRGASSSTRELRKNTSSTTSIKDLYNVVPISPVDDKRDQQTKTRKPRHSWSVHNYDPLRCQLTVCSNVYNR